jgi:hypothetical protein
MINKLTKEQEAYLEVFRKKCFDRGTSTEEADWEKAERAISEMYKIIGKTPPEFVRCDSPLHCILTINEATSQGQSTKLTISSNYLLGQQEYYWIGFYLFCETIGVKYDEESSHRLRLWKDVSDSIGWWWPYENICLMSNRPELCHYDEQRNQMHCDDGPALRFRDGYEMYVLHGVRVQKELVMTPAEDLDPEMLLREANAEVRKEIIRKIGIERCLNELDSEVLDHRDDIIGGPYTLVSLNVQERKRPYLKMHNPSTGEIHIEGVAPEIVTVDDALTSRKPEEMRKIPVSDDGDSWAQHGDVIIWPQDAKSLKPYPEIIT